jgi:hypothetical protein
MKRINNSTQPLRITHLLLSFFIIISLPACLTNKKPDKKDDAVVIVTNTMDFQMADTIQSGWQTFRYANKSHETHFFLLDKYPEGKTIKDGELEVIIPFQKGMDLINEGKAEEGFEEFNKLPAWFFEIVFSGGSGLISPGQTSETTLKLDPGYYIVECYVKMANGMFHSSMGMIKELIVLEESTGKEAPKADVELSISSTEGIMFSEPINKGKQTFSVFFKDQITHENFVGHDVHLVKLKEEADMEALEKWMNWADPKGLITPSPEGITFLGGVNDMPGGSKGYFEVNLKPGNYAFVAEVPNTLEKNMLKTFSVSE